MNASYKITAILVASLFSSSCNTQEPSSHINGRSDVPKDSALNPGNSYHLTDDEFIAVKNKAQQGDINAMNTLIDYYWIYSSDSDSALEWVKKAAEAGDIGAKKTLTQYCSSHGKHPVCNQALQGGPTEPISSRL